MALQVYCGDGARDSGFGSSEIVALGNTICSAARVVPGTQGGSRDENWELPVCKTG